MKYFNLTVQYSFFMSEEANIKFGEVENTVVCMIGEILVIQERANVV